MRFYLALAIMTCALAFSQATTAMALPLTDSSLKAPSLVEQAACRTIRSRVVRPNGRVVFRTVRRCTPDFRLGAAGPSPSGSYARAAGLFTSAFGAADSGRSALTLAPSRLTGGGASQAIRATPVRDPSATLAQALPRPPHSSQIAAESNFCLNI